VNSSVSRSNRKKNIANANAVNPYTWTVILSYRMCRSTWILSPFHHRMRSSSPPPEGSEVPEVVFVPVEHLHLQPAEEVLHNRVVVAVAHPAGEGHAQHGHRLPGVRAPRDVVSHYLADAKVQHQREVDLPSLVLEGTAPPSIKSEKKPC
jgi:hypothetical protein